MNEIFGNPSPDYILLFKNNYGVEIALFSFFNESCGINVRQTPSEHAALIKRVRSLF